MSWHGRFTLGVPLNQQTGLLQTPVVVAVGGQVYHPRDPEELVGDHLPLSEKIGLADLVHRQSLERL